MEDSSTSCTHKKGQGGALHHPGLCSGESSRIVQTLFLRRMRFVISATDVRQILYS
jgi:hypothetical protein